LFEVKLPVPRPLAALCEHRGIFSTGAIMTARIEEAQPLADLLPATGIESGLWAKVGRCISRFHRAGVWHADLNARNILLTAEPSVFLIDFDRARFTPGHAVAGKDNLSRLYRSLQKFWPVSQTSNLQTAWHQLLTAYHD